MVSLDFDPVLSLVWIRLTNWLLLLCLNRLRRWGKQPAEYELL